MDFAGTWRGRISDGPSRFSKLGWRSAVLMMVRNEKENLPMQVASRLTVLTVELELPYFGPMGDYFWTHLIAERWTEACPARHFNGLSDEFQQSKPITRDSQCFGESLANKISDVPERSPYRDFFPRPLR
jgi:hypothetical protein